MRKKDIYKKFFSFFRKKIQQNRKSPRPIHIHVQRTTEIYDSREEDKNWINPILHVKIVLENQVLHDRSKFSIGIIRLGDYDPKNRGLE